MSENDFQQKMFQLLGEIQGTQKAIYDDVCAQKAEIKEVSTLATKAKSSADSAHHRIDTFRTDICIICSVIAFFISLGMTLFLK